MTTRGLIAMSHAANTAQAWADWRFVAEVLEGYGLGDIIQAHTPPPDAGWKTIDKCIAAVRVDVRQRIKAPTDEPHS